MKEKNIMANNKNIERKENNGTDRRDKNSDRLAMSAIILAGGKSSRMGRDKSTVLFNGKPLLARAIEMLEPVFSEVIIVTNQEIPFEIGNAKIVHDEIPYQGPLGGINAGLKAAKYDESFVVAVDMPFINIEVIKYLAKFTKEADVVVPLTQRGLEPLFAIYSKKCLPTISNVLQKGERKMLSMLAFSNVKAVSQAELKDYDNTDQTFININTERELEEAEFIACEIASTKILDNAEQSIKTEQSIKDKLFTNEGLATGLAINKNASKTVKCATDEEFSKEKKNKILNSANEKMPVERPTTIFVNSEELVTVQSSFEHVDELACGFLVAEGIIQSRDELESIRIDNDRGEVRVRLKNERPFAKESMGKRFITSGCGKGFSFVSLGDAMGMAKIVSDFKVKADIIPSLMKEFLHRSGRPGMHSSAIIRDEEILFIRQDIGRHNTIDMILGKLWLDSDIDRNIMLFTTGRISYEMMVKAGKARIPIVVSRTAATDLAVTLAKRLNIELIGYVRAGNMHVYTDAARII